MSSASRSRESSLSDRPRKTLYAARRKTHAHVALTHTQRESWRSPRSSGPRDLTRGYKRGRDGAVSNALPSPRSEHEYVQFPRNPQWHCETNCEQMQVPWQCAHVHVHAHAPMHITQTIRITTITPTAGFSTVNTTNTAINPPGPTHTEVREAIQRDSARAPIRKPTVHT